VKNGLVRSTIVLVAAFATIAVNMAAVLLPLNGNSTGELADRFQVYFVPAGYVFSIWSLIYLQLVAFAVWQSLKAQRDDERLAGIAPAFVASCVANASWIFLWHYEQFTWSLVAMLVLLGSLIWIYVRLDIGRAVADARMRWLVHALFSVYLGWITVATIANVTSVLDYVGWGGWGISAEWWAAIMLAVACALAAVIGHVRRDALYLAVLVWAFVGIAVKFPDTSIVTPAAWLASIFVAALIALSLWRRSRAGQPLVPA